MYTSHSIEKIAASNRREALVAADQRRLAREVRRTAPRPAAPATTGVGTTVPRPHRWFDMSAVWQ